MRVCTWVYACADVACVCAGAARMRLLRVYVDVARVCGLRKCVYSVRVCANVCTSAVCNMLYCAVCDVLCAFALYCRVLCHTN